MGNLSFRMTSTVAVVVVFLLIAAAAAVVFAQDPINQGYGPPGPISSWPAAWTDFCSQPFFLGFRLPVFGDKTTDVQMVAPLGGTLPNDSLDQIYARIVDSTAFKNASAGFGWVTIFWGLQEAGPASSLSEYAIGQFILVSGGRPDPAISFGIIQADYDLSTGSVSIQTGIGASCGAM
jgi:hypothetical protein